LRDLLGMDTEDSRPSIKTGFLVYNLIGDTAGVDLTLSVGNYSRLLLEALYAVYPEEAVAISVGDQCVAGSVPESLRTHASGFADDAAVEARVDEIAEHVRQSGDCLVRA